MDRVYMKTPADDYDIDRINEMLKLVGIFFIHISILLMVNLRNSERRKRRINTSS